MARETFISYKFSEARPVRDAICVALGDDARFYRGETSDSPNLADRTTDTIKNNLKDMIHGTSVTVAVISPNMTQSNWIDWEIEYSLKEIKRGDIHSNINGVVGVVMEINGNTDWFVSHKSYPCGCRNRFFDTGFLPAIITENRHNRKERVKKEAIICEKCGAIDAGIGSYFSLIDESEFLDDPANHIERAYQKSKSLDSFNITKTVI